MPVKNIKTITISLPEPCAEDWEQMKPMGCGRFCQQCQKTVIDFTVLPDDTVVRLLSNAATGQLCGRFSEEQLNRPIPLPPPLQKGFLHYFGTAAVFLAPYFSAIPSIAQKATQTTLNERDSGTAPATPIRIKGRITDALTGNPMTRMEISIEGLDKQYSDRFGRFSFTLPADWTGRRVTINAAYQPLSTAPKENTVILEETVAIEAGKKLYEIALMRYPAGNAGINDSSIIIETTPIFQRTTYGGGGAPVITEKIVYKPSLWRRIAWLFRHKKRNH